MATSSLLWHNDIHKKWGDQKLVFLFLSYEPTYHRETAVARLQDFLQEEEICAYQVYEVTAPYDLLVRAWVPARMQRNDLLEGLGNCDKTVTIHHVLDVVEIVHHWPWAKGHNAKVGDMHRPAQAILDTVPPLRERESLNSLQRMANSNGAGPARKPKLPGIYRDRWILTRPKYRAGIRFLVLLKVWQPEGHEALQRRICSLLYQARNTIRNPSVYRLDDPHHTFLIFGQVDEKEGRFHAISERLVSQINDYASPGNARTYSTFFACPGFLDFRDELNLPDVEEKLPEPDVERLLRQQEGQRLEVKGSAFTELHNWLVNGKRTRRTKRPATDPNNKAVNSLMRAIASMLNSDGGHIVVGALERSKYGGEKQFQELPTLKPKSPYGILGLDFDYGDGDWDSFARTLRTAIDARFDPIPGPRWLRIRQAEAAGRELCVIDVAKPDEWVYAKVGKKGSGEKGKRRNSLKRGFYVRVDGSTRELADRKLDDYRRDNPR